MPLRFFTQHDSVPCMVAGSPTPWNSSGAPSRFFPEDFGLTSPRKEVRRSRHSLLWQLQHGRVFRGCKHSFMFRPPCSPGPRVAPAPGILFQGGRAVYTTHSLVGYLPQEWYRRVHESGNLHGGTFTHWIMSLSAAPLGHPPEQHHRR